MLSKYKDFHLENLHTSLMVRQPVFYDKANNIVNNATGRYWADIGDYITGLHDARSRLGTFTNPWGATSNKLFVPPPVRAVEDSLSDLLDRRACELLTDQRKIAVMWSGGIDSTCVLVSLIKNTSDLTRLVVYCNNNSIVENPEFYKNFLVGKIECRETASLDVTDDFIKSHILLHGDPGDCLYGPSMLMYRHLIPDGQHLLPWKSNRDLIARGINEFRNRPTLNTKSEAGFADWYIAKVNNNIEEVGTYTINTIADWWWWHYFNLKWEFSILRPLYGSRQNRRAAIRQDSLASFIRTTFYNTEYFQNWSYTNLSKLCLDPSRHKSDAKQYIFELDHNELYFQTKRKTESIAHNVSQYPTYIDKNTRPYYLTDPGVRPAMLELLEQYRG
jgi:hypothetical protein